MDPNGRIYTNYAFNERKFTAWLSRHNIPWPLHATGRPMLDTDTFKEQARRFPIINLLHELRGTTSKLRLTGLAVGADGFNRCMLSPFSSVTGRNQPSNAKYIFGPATWLRGLIRPPEGYGVSYLDFSAQEVAIAAALSGDQPMIDGYTSGDPHLDFAKAIGLVPADATKHTHGPARDRCKALVLGVLFGMEAFGLAARLGIQFADATALLDLHKRRHRRFWEWSRQVTSSAVLTHRMRARLGWQRRIDAECNPRSLMNWPMQANGAEMLRLACIGLVEAGVTVCAPVHDAILLMAPLDRLDHDIARARAIMARAGAAITGGLDLRVGADTVRFPDRYADGRGADMWRRVQGILARGLRPSDPAVPPASEAAEAEAGEGVGGRLMRKAPARRVYTNVGCTSETGCFTGETPRFTSVTPVPCYMVVIGLIREKQTNHPASLPLSVNPCLQWSILG